MGDALDDAVMWPTDARFLRDAQLYAIICKHFTPEQAARLVDEICKPLSRAHAAEHDCEQQKHAPLFRAIRQSGRQ